MASLEMNPTAEEYVTSETMSNDVFDEPSPKYMLALAAAVFSTATVIGPDPLSTKNNFRETTTPIFIESKATLNELYRDRVDNKAFKRIRELGLYSENWDGTGAIPPTGQAINDAESFLRVLLGREVTIPHISLAADGEINFLWNLKEIRLDLGFYGDQTYSYYGKGKDGKEYLEDEVAIANSLPEEMVNLLR
jgi:hypothetical protein